MMVSRDRQTVPSDAYFLITVKWKGGFTHKVPCRGYGLKSQLAFTKSLDWVESFYYEECDKEDYDLRIYGDGSEFEENEDGRTSKAKTQQKTPAKRKPRAKGTEDSKAVRGEGGNSTQTTKKKPTVVRKPKLPAVRKPKKDVQGTNNSRTKAPSKSRRSA